MPASARKETVRPGVPGIFHTWQRCVRRAFLLGKDRYTGKDYSHRRDWVLDRLELLAANFAIGICFFAVMSNHLHLVLRSLPRRVKRMGDYEVARRWLRVYPGRRVLDGNWSEPTEEQVEKLARNKEKIKEIRKRLCDISWFMRAFSEHIARRANDEEDSSGRFWSGRFACREITNEAGLLICGMYVDLNELRAGQAASPELAMHSSIGLRLAAAAQGGEPAWLAPLTLAGEHVEDSSSVLGKRASDQGLLPISLEAYTRLLSDLAAQDAERKRRQRNEDDTTEETDGPNTMAWSSEVVQLLDQLGVVAEQFAETIFSFPGCFRRLIGSRQDFVERAQELGRRWLHGAAQAAKIFR